MDSYDDSQWTLANNTTSVNGARELTTPVSLYAGDYGVGDPIFPLQSKILTLSSITSELIFSEAILLPLEPSRESLSSWVVVMRLDIPSGSTILSWEHQAEAHLPPRRHLPPNFHPRWVKTQTMFLLSSLYGNPAKTRIWDADMFAIGKYGLQREWVWWNHSPLMIF